MNEFKIWAVAFSEKNRPGWTSIGDTDRPTLYESNHSCSGTWLKSLLGDNISYVKWNDGTIFDVANNAWVEERFIIKDSDPVNHPQHYTSHPSGVECITVTEHMSFNLGNAVKYIWRADLKGSSIQDLEKAAWYIAREIAKRKKLEADSPHVSSK